jgi:hypothetical protein
VTISIAGFGLSFIDRPPKLSAIVIKMTEADASGEFPETNKTPTSGLARFDA